jgi:hypothetical protein
VSRQWTVPVGAVTLSMSQAGEWLVLTFRNGKGELLNKGHPIEVRLRVDFTDPTKPRDPGVIYVPPKKGE